MVKRSGGGFSGNTAWDLLDDGYTDVGRIGNDGGTEKEYGMEWGGHWRS